MNKYENFSKEDLIELLNKQDKELKRKKYGLSWDAEKEPEKVVVDCKNNLPVLKNINNKNIISDDNDDFNIMIEGDNYHALQVLNYTHKGKIDVIYIDPPYNTGNKDFKYNDKFVEKEDGYRHSKWLNFMEKRLDLAKELLKESGVIFISIDDNEQANLKLLCDKIFGEANFVATMVRESKSGGGHDSQYLAIEYDYVLSYVKNKIIKTNFNKYILDVENDKRYKYNDVHTEHRGKYYLRDLDYNGSYSKSLDYPITLPSGKILYAGNKIGKPNTWRWNKEKYEWGLENDFVVTDEDKGKIYIKQYQYVDNENNKRIRTIPYRGLTKYLNSSGTTELVSILYSASNIAPKPRELITYLLEISSKKNSIILDFFAGSGTTAHAVLTLNKEDGGNRKFIVCTNNENNIAEEICYPRIQKVIKGYTKSKNGEKVDGLGGNLKYFKTDFVKNTGNQLKLKLDITKKCTEMLCLKNNIFNLEQESDNYKIFSNNNKDSYVAIYYNFYDDDIDEFINNIKQINKKTIVYIFSLDNYADKEHFRDYKNIKVEPIPQQILDVYSKIQKEHIK